MIALVHPTGWDYVITAVFLTGCVVALFQSYRGRTGRAAGAGARARARRLRPSAGHGGRHRQREGERVVTNTLYKPGELSDRWLQIDARQPLAAAAVIISPMMTSWASSVALLTPEPVVDYGWFGALDDVARGAGGQLSVTADPATLPPHSVDVIVAHRWTTSELAAMQDEILEATDATGGFLWIATEVQTDDKGIIPVSAVLARQEGDDQVATEAYTAAVELGIPPALFIGLCEWIDKTPISSDNLGYRYDPNTRAHALAACRLLVDLAGFGTIERAQR